MLHDDMKTIGRRLCCARLLRGYSMSQLAPLAGLDKSTISRYEAGYIDRVPFAALMVLADALGVYPPWLMGSETDKPTRDPSENAWLAECEHLLTERPLSVKRLSPNSRFLSAIGSTD